MATLAPAGPRATPEGALANVVNEHNHLGATDRRVASRAPGAARDERDLGDTPSALSSTSAYRRASRSRRARSLAGG